MATGRSVSARAVCNFGLSSPRDRPARVVRSGAARSGIRRSIDCSACKHPQGMSCGDDFYFSRLRCCQQRSRDNRDIPKLAGEIHAGLLRSVVRSPQPHTVVSHLKLLSGAVAFIASMPWPHAFVGSSANNSRRTGTFAAPFRSSRILPTT
jgi:hypothetical protein